MIFDFDPVDGHLGLKGDGLKPCSSEVSTSTNNIESLAIPSSNNAKVVHKNKCNGFDGDYLAQDQKGQKTKHADWRTNITQLDAFSDEERLGSITSIHGTPPIDILMSPAMSRSRSRSRRPSKTGSTMDSNTPKFDQLTTDFPRKKRRSQKQMPVPAINTIRGFVTPATSCDDDSDFSTDSVFKKSRPRTQPDTNSTGNPMIRPSSSNGGISALRKELEALNADVNDNRTLSISRDNKSGCHTPSTTDYSSGPQSEDDMTGTTNYEIALEHDFVSADAPDGKDADEVEMDLMLEKINRKMAANDFEPLRCLGKGAFGTVLLVKHVATGRLYAQKQFSKASLTIQKRLVEQTKTERVILENINSHPFVVKLYYAFQDQEKLYLILEYAQGGELFSRLATEKMLPEDTVAFYLAEMVLALEHLHNNVGVVYRDLKPENILLDSEGHLLLTDFGLSKVAVDGEHQCKTIAGTTEYMAPEVVLGQKHGTAVDWWSLGILGFDLLTGSTPFYANNQAKIQEKIVKSKPTFPFFLSADAKDILTRFLRKEPNKRLGTCMPKDMQTIKKHRFFRKINWKSLESRELEPPIKPLITDPELAENFATEFTDLAISPVRAQYPQPSWDMRPGEESNPFGGFSFVASSSLLQAGNGFF